MAFDCFLKIDGIPGESTDDKHKDWIEVLSFKHGVSQSAGGTRSTAAGSTGAGCSHGEFSITKTLDKASPKLALYCCNATNIKEVTIELCRAVGDKQKYMEYKLSNVIVSSVRPEGSPQSGGGLPVEEVSFNYGKIEWIYTETDHRTGKPKGDVKTHWDKSTNKGG
jgi:type VI secretion system secreted protein Hcp